MSNNDVPKNSELIKGVAVLVSFLGYGIITYIGLVFMILLFSSVFHPLWMVPFVFAEFFSAKIIYVSNLMVGSILGEANNDEAEIQGRKWATIWFWCWMVSCLLAAWFDGPVVIEVNTEINAPVVERVTL